MLMTPEGQPPRADYKNKPTISREAEQSAAGAFIKQTTSEFTIQHAIFNITRKEQRFSGLGIKGETVVG